MSRRCAGQPHVPRAVVRPCTRPRHAPAPILAHMLAHLASADVCTYVHTSGIGLCSLHFACRWDLKRPVQSSLRTMRSPCDRCGLVLTALQCWRCWRCARYTVVSAEWGNGDISRALVRLCTAGSSSQCHGLNLCTRTGGVVAFLVVFSVRYGGNVGSPVGAVLDVRATHLPTKGPCRHYHSQQVKSTG